VDIFNDLSQPTIAVVHGQLRPEERLLFREFEHRGITVERIDDSRSMWIGRVMRNPRITQTGRTNRKRRASPSRWGSNGNETTTMTMCSHSRRSAWRRCRTWA
jgi:hypothetical protein